MNIRSVIERLEEIEAENPRTTVQMMDEGGTWFNVLGIDVSKFVDIDGTDVVATMKVAPA